MTLEETLNEFDCIAFDADDTLWHNESLYSITQDNFKNLLSNYHEPEWIDHKLYETEMRNLRYFGYGIKGFTLSMIETAIELTEGRISGREIQRIVDFAKEMLKAPTVLLPDVKAVLGELSRRVSLMIITKGDLFDQESKIARSGIADYFAHIEIVSEKNTEIYGAILEKHDIPPQRFLMVGNSLRSDILPVVELGSRAVHIPYQITWQHETVKDSEVDEKKYFQIDTIADLPKLLNDIILKKQK